jgi:hypothetical protein
MILLREEHELSGAEVVPMRQLCRVAPIRLPATLHCVEFFHAVYRIGGEK